VKLVLAATICTFLIAASAASAWAQATAKGAKVYTDQKCQVCHAIAGKGNAKGKLDGVGGKLTEDEIREWITDPVGMATKHKADRKPPMQAKYASLPKDDLDALVGYLASLKK
jgi:mono/diheme cytochrome c family protein